MIDKETKNRGLTQKQQGPDLGPEGNQFDPSVCALNLAALLPPEPMRGSGRNFKLTNSLEDLAQSEREPWPGSCSSGRSAPGLLQLSPWHFSNCTQLSCWPSNTRSQMSDEKEFDVYLLLPLHFVGQETEAQTLRGWYMPFGRCLALVLPGEDRTAIPYQTGSRRAGNLPSPLGHRHRTCR